MIMIRRELPQSRGVRHRHIIACCTKVLRGFSVPLPRRPSKKSDALGVSPAIIRRFLKLNNIIPPLNSGTSINYPPSGKQISLKKESLKFLRRECVENWLFGRHPRRFYTYKFRGVAAMGRIGPWCTKHNSVNRQPARSRRAGRRPSPFGPGTMANWLQFV